MAKSGKMLHAGSSPGPGVRPRLARYLHMRHQLRLGLAFIAVVVVFGTTGYMLIERWGFLDSLFMTTITLSSVGYGETHPLHDSGRVFTIVLIMGGVAALGNLINQLAWAVSEGYFQEGINLRRRIKMISNLDQHYIVCGYGRIGQQIAKDLAAEGAPFVVIEKNPEQVRLVEEQGYPALVGDASTDQMLNQAGIERARCVLCALPSDAENLYIVLSAKLLNPKVVVISRSASAEGAAKLAKIGADRIVSPYLTGAKRMATLALRPQGVDLLDTLLVGAGQVYIQEILLPGESKCPFINKTLRDAALRGESGAIVLGIRRSTGEILGGPSSSTVLHEGDLLICLGSGEELGELLRRLLPGQSRRPRH